MSNPSPAVAPDSPDRYASRLQSLNRISSRVTIFLLIVLAVTVVGFPLFWMVISSMKPAAEFYVTPPTFLPHTWTLANYHDLFAQTSFPTYFLNSLIVASSTTVLSLVLGGLGAYSLSRFQYKSMKVFAQLTLLSYMLPEVLVVIPLYVYVVKFGLADTLASLIIGNMAFTLPLTLWYMRAYFNAIPVSLEESAMVDGCTRFQALWRVILPLAVPGLVSTGVFCFNHAWDEFLFALVFTSSESNKVLTLGLATWIGQDTIYSWGMLLAAAVLVTIPVMIFYFLVQGKLTVGMTEGSSKG
jgi:ABC-type glycerol-3-phosphate transport system permease component